MQGVWKKKQYTAYKMAGVTNTVSGSFSPIKFYNCYTNDEQVIAYRKMKCRKMKLRKMKFCVFCFKLKKRL